MHGLNNPFPAPGADDVHRQFSLGPPSLLLRRHLEKKKVNSTCKTLKPKRRINLERKQSNCTGTEKDTEFILLVSRHTAISSIKISFMVHQTVII